MKPKPIDILKKCQQGPAWGRAKAIVILHPSKPGQHGTIRVAYPADGAGKLHAFLWDMSGTGLQYGAATGYGYDKLSAALSGLKFDDLVFTDHPENWELMLREHGYQIIHAL